MNNAVLSYALLHVIFTPSEYSIFLYKTVFTDSSLLSNSYFFFECLFLTRHGCKDFLSFAPSSYAGFSLSPIAWAILNDHEASSQLLALWNPTELDKPCISSIYPDTPSWTPEQVRIFQLSTVFSSAFRKPFSYSFHLCAENAQKWGSVYLFTCTTACCTPSLLVVLLIHTPKLKRGIRLLSISLCLRQALCRLLLTTSLFIFLWN